MLLDFYLVVPSFTAFPQTLNLLEHQVLSDFSLGFHLVGWWILPASFGFFLLGFTEFWKGPSRPLCLSRPLRADGHEGGPFMEQRKKSWCVCVCVCFSIDVSHSGPSRTSFCGRCDWPGLSANRRAPLPDRCEAKIPVTSARRRLLSKWRAHRFRFRFRFFLYIFQRKDNNNSNNNNNNNNNKKERTCGQGRPVCAFRRRSRSLHAGAKVANRLPTKIKKRSAR